MIVGLEILDGIERSVVMTGHLVGGVDEGRWSAATPCAGWTVRDVVNHVVGGMRIFAAQLSGREAEAEHEADWLGGDPVGAYAEAAELDLAGWRRPGAMAGTVSISLGTLPADFAAVIHLVELLVHGVDVAVATDQRHLIDETLCDRVLSSLVAMGGVDAYRTPGIFDTAVVAGPDASAHERLSAYLGRDLTRQRSAVVGSAV
jgi:uncharacterized protein (TIGR03086 family)